MKLLVCGGRDFTDAAFLNARLDEYMEGLVRVAGELPITHVIHGGARGADTLAGQWAKAKGIQEVICPANWDVYSKRAGFIRNAHMAALLDETEDVVIAFPGGAGTASMVTIAKKLRHCLIQYLKDKSNNE